MFSCSGELAQEMIKTQKNSHLPWIYVVNEILWRTRHEILAPDDRLGGLRPLSVVLKHSRSTEETEYRPETLVSIEICLCKYLPESQRRDIGYLWYNSKSKLVRLISSIKRNKGGWERSERPKKLPERTEFSTEDKEKKNLERKWLALACPYKS